MAENNQVFTLVGRFQDGITPKLKKLAAEFDSLSKNLDKSFAKSFKNIENNLDRFEKRFDKNIRGGMSKTFKSLKTDLRDFSKEAGRLGAVFNKKSFKSINGLTTSLEDAAKSAGKVRDTVSQIGEGGRGLGYLNESLEGAARAAGRAADGVGEIGTAAGRANGQADDLMTTLLKAQGLSKFGDAMSIGFQRGVSGITTVAQKGAGIVGKAIKEAMEDELSDIKAASGIQGSFKLAGFEGSFRDSEKMYKKYDQVVSEMIRQSSAPTAKVVELQRYTLDTMGPLMLAAEGVAKGTKMADIDPKKIESSAKNYGAFLEKAALFSQGTGSAGFRVAAGLEQLVTRGKIDTTLDFFTDNIMLMKNLEKAGFGGRGGKTTKMMTATDAERMKAMMDAFKESMSGESTAAMAESLTGSLQGLQDTLFNPSVGILGMAVTFTKDEQKAANKSIKEVMGVRLASYRKELKNTKISAERRQQLEANVAQNILTTDKLVKEDRISTPFKALSFSFTELVRRLTEVINAVGPVFTKLSISLINVTSKVFGPLAETLQNVASDMRGGKYTQSEGFGRIIGEIFKTIGKIFADIAQMLTDPKGAMNKVQSQFMKGFMDAFRLEPGSLEKAKKGISDGIDALIKKVISILLSFVTSETLRPLMVPLAAAMFGPPVISAVIAGITPLILTESLKFIGVLFARANLLAAATPLPTAAPVPRLSQAQKLVSAPPLVPVPPVPPPAALGPVGKTLGVVKSLAGPAAIATAFIMFDTQILGFAEWLKNTGMKMRDSANVGAVGLSILLAGVGSLLQGLTNFIKGAFDMVVALFTGDIEKIKQGFVRMMQGLAQAMGGLVVSVIGVVATLGGGVIEACKNVVRALISGIEGIDLDFFNLIPGKGGKPPAEKTKTKAFGEPGKYFPSLEEAIGYENKHKPPGSDLVIANSSETIIPAANGLNAGMNMDGVISAIFSAASNTASTMATGFMSLNNTLKANQARNEQVIRSSAANTQAAIRQSTVMSMQGDRQILAAIKTASAAGGMFGGAMGTGKGSLGAAEAMARSMGLTTTSGYRPGDPGYHGANRARDFSNGTGPTPQMMSYAQKMVGAYGTSLTELIYTPLGYSIKNGKKVAPYAQAAHYNHVHVAFGRGPGNPTMFSNAKAAAAYEGMMAPAGAKIASVTANSSEFGGEKGTMNLTQNISVSGALDPKATAEAVWAYTTQAVDRLRYNNYG